MQLPSLRGSPNNADLTRRSLECGADVDVRDRQGWTPLHWAAASTRGTAELIKLLLKAGCDTMARNKQGRTALDLAVLFNRTTLKTVLEAEGGNYLTMPNDDDESVWEDFESARFCDECTIVKSPSLPSHQMLTSLLGDEVFER